MRIATYCAAGVMAMVLGFHTTALKGDLVHDVLAKIDTNRGVVALLELPDGDPRFPVDLATASELTVYVQCRDADRATAIRQAAEEAGLLGQRVFVATGAFESIHLSDNVADCILASPPKGSTPPDKELLRAVRPGGAVFVGDRKMFKPVPHGIDEWTHPYHGPDNNPQSTDQLVRGDLGTQFLGFPKFSPMPEQSVIAGGRIFKAMGHIAHKANQNEMLNTLLCINAYNGTVLWKRPLAEGFMIHRNTMIATEDALYLGDHESCKIIDARRGDLRGQFTVPEGVADGPVWKWMAMRNGVLYALVGNPEVHVDTQRSARRGLGHWPWGMWEGHDYADPRTAFGFGRTVLAIDLETGKTLWHYRDEEFLDARAVCMNEGRIYCFSPGRFLACIDVADGTLLWKNSDQDLLEAIGPRQRAQHYVTGYATTCYLKCSQDYLFFAGPQQIKTVAASADNGKLAWTHPTGNLQLVLRDDAVWAAGPEHSNNGVRLDYATGKVLSKFPARRACTRATGCADSIFFRANGGTVRVMTDTNTSQHIDPMRPPCQDGVLVSNGHLYWGPWMCGCQLSLYGNICLRPANPLREVDAGSYQTARTVAANFDTVESLPSHSRDWTSYRGGNARTDTTQLDVPADVELKWTVDVAAGVLPTAPVTSGGLVFVADRSGVVRALDTNGQLVWKSYVAGPVYYPPAVAHDRVFVGAADGRVYAFEARTGRSLWSFRVGPEDRWIPVFGKLISVWPVAGGVVVEDNTVYAAAGIAHYDGTYIVALDVVTGQLKAHNSTSGTLSVGVNNGISVQGNLSVVDDELQFLAGGVYETARYDLKTLQCLNTPKEQVSSQFRTAFYPHYPVYGKYVSLDHTCANGCTLSHDASYEGSVFTNLSRQEPLPPGTPRERKEAARWIQRRGGHPPKTLWTDQEDRRFTSFVVSSDQLLAAGHLDENPQSTFLVAIRIQDGSDAWRKEIPALAVKGGIALDDERQIYVSLENGQLLCFGPQSR